MPFLEIPFPLHCKTLADARQNAYHETRSQVLLGRVFAASLLKLGLTPSKESSSSMLYKATVVFQIVQR